MKECAQIQNKGSKVFNQQNLISFGNFEPWENQLITLLSAETRAIIHGDNQEGKNVYCAHMILRL